MVPNIFIIGDYTTEKYVGGASLVVQWLSLCAPNTGALGLVPDQGARSHVLQLRVHKP